MRRRVLGIGLVVAAAILSGVLWQETALERRYAADGVETVGTVTARIVETRRIGDEDRAEGHALAYSFVPEGGGAAVEGRAPVAVPLWEAAEAGGPVPVQYLAADPGTSRVPPRDPWVPIRVWAGIAALLLIAGAAILITRPRPRP